MIDKERLLASVERARMVLNLDDFVFDCDARDFKEVAFIGYRFGGSWKIYLPLVKAEVELPA